DDGGGAEGALGDAGADHVDAVEGGLGGDVLLVAVAGEARVGDLGDEVLGHLVLAGDLPGPLPDLPGALAPPGGCRYPDFLQVLLGGSQQRLALAGPFGGQDRVVAADQPIAGARSEVIQSIPPSLRRSSIRVPVIIPRSPAMIRFLMPKSSRTRVIAV